MFHLQDVTHVPPSIVISPSALTFTDFNCYGLRLVFAARCCTASDTCSSQRNADPYICGSAEVTMTSCNVGLLHRQVRSLTGIALCVCRVGSYYRTTPSRRPGTAGLLVMHDRLSRMSLCELHSLVMVSRTAAASNRSTCGKF